MDNTVQQFLNDLSKIKSESSSYPSATFSDVAENITALIEMYRAWLEALRKVAEVYQIIYHHQGEIPYQLEESTLKTAISQVSQRDSENLNDRVERAIECLRKSLEENFRTPLG